MNIFRKKLRSALFFGLIVSAPIITVACGTTESDAEKLVNSRTEIKKVFDDLEASFKKDRNQISVANFEEIEDLVKT
jgi:hypothetical protein